MPVLFACIQSHAPLIAVLLNYHPVRKVCNLTIWIQQASAYVVCLDLRSSPQVS